jgi:hypothetical protein
MPTAEQRPEPSTKCENKAKTNKEREKAQNAKKNAFIAIRLQQLITTIS